MKTTQKQVRELKKEARISVIAFDMETGKRYSTYGGCDIITALDEALRKTSLGYKVLFVDYNIHPSISIKFELNITSRCTYEDILPYSMNALQIPKK